MSTIYTQQITLIVPAASIATANALAATLRNNPADGSTFTLNCSPTGANPATNAIAGPTPILPSGAKTVIGGMIPRVAGSSYYLTDAASGILLATNSATAQASVGKPWSAAQSLADQGLQMVRGKGP
jgi:hypothetical protein